MDTEQLARLTAAVAARYDIQRKLGEGGMASVYLARDLKHDRLVALKVLRPELAVSLGARRFLQEIRITAGLNHPHVLSLYDSDEADGFLYYVMPYVEGESLRARLQREGQLPVDEAIRLAGEVAQALSHAHARGLVHRDIKPENILLSESHAVVADFGISRAVRAAGGSELTRTGMAVGTPAYMSPEQSAGDPAVDHRSDIYSLGCVLYEMIIGQIPFPAPNAQAMMARHTLEPVPSPSIMRPGLPRALEDVVVRALAKNPADRFADAAGVVAALEAASRGDRVGPGPTGRRDPPARRALLVAAVLGAVAIGALAFQLVGGGGAGVPAPGPPTSTSVAVLPLENTGGDPGDRYLGAGLTAELGDALSAVSGLRVAGRRSAAALTERNASPLVIGRDLGVDAILQGQFRKTGEDIQLSVRLVDAADGGHLWSEQYGGNLQNLSGVSGEIAASVSRILLDAPIASTASNDAPSEADPMAYDKYLWGLFNLDRRTEEGALDAIDNFTMAIGFDSTFADAYAGLADAHLALLSRAAAPQSSKVLSDARAAAETSLRLDPELGRARASLGAIKFNTFDWAGAEAEYVRALEVTPNDPVVRQRYAQLLMSLGRGADATVHARAAVERDPLSTAAWHSVLDATRASGDYPAARRAGQEILQLNSNEAEPWFELGLLFLLEENPADGGNSFERYAELRGVDPAPFREFVAAADRYADDGVRGQLPDALPGLLQGQPLTVAVLHVLVGEDDVAIAIIRRAHRNRDPSLTAILARPELTVLRTRPEVRAVLADLGLAGR